MPSFLVYPGLYIKLSETSERESGGKTLTGKKKKEVA